MIEEWFQINESIIYYQFWKYAREKLLGMQLKLKPSFNINEYEWGNAQTKHTFKIESHKNIWTKVFRFLNNHLEYGLQVYESFQQAL